MLWASSCLYSYCSWILRDRPRRPCIHRLSLNCFQSLLHHLPRLKTLREGWNLRCVRHWRLLSGRLWEVGRRRQSRQSRRYPFVRSRIGRARYKYDVCLAHVRTNMYKLCAFSSVWQSTGIETASQVYYNDIWDRDTYQHDNIGDQQQADRTGSARRRSMDPCYGGDGHVQPIPSKWTKFRRCLRTSAGVNGRRLASLLNMHYLQPVILVTTALIVGLCEIINGAKVKSLATFYSNFFLHCHHCLIPRINARGLRPGADVNTLFI